MPAIFPLLILYLYMSDAGAIIVAQARRQAARDEGDPPMAL
jgi:hypothetical protein